MALRGSGVNAGLAAPTQHTQSVPFPAGAAVGDLCIIYFGSTHFGWSPAGAFPAGWTNIFTSSFQTVVASRVLTSGDISAGSVAVWGQDHIIMGAYDFVWAMVTFIGAPAIRETDGVANFSSNVITTSSAVLSTDVGIYMGGDRGVLGAPNNVCLSRGILLGKTNSPDASGNYGIGLYAEGHLPGGAYSIEFSFSQDVGAGDSVVVIVEGVDLPTGAPSVSCGNPPVAIVGTPYSHGLIPNNLSCTNVWTLTSGSLPPGLSMDGSSGAITGTPTTIGVYPFSVHVAYGAQFGFPVDALPYGVDTSCSITVDVPMSIDCASPPAGAVGVPYTHTFPATGGTPAYTFSIISGALPAGLSLNAFTGVVSGTPTTPGTSPFRIQVADSLSLTAFVDCSITISGTALSISCASPPDGVVGNAYSHTFPAAGGSAPYTFAIIAGALPTGLNLDTSTGVVSGTPTVAGVSSFTIQVTDSLSSTASVPCGITVDPAVSIACGSPPNGTVGTAYTHTFPVTAGTPPFTFSIISGALPPGLNLAPSTGIVSGVPVAEGTYPFTIQVSDSLSNTASVGCSITVIRTVTAICNNPPAGLVGAFYTHTIGAIGGTPPYTFAIVGGSLPPGLSLDSSSGVISGIPTIAGSFPFMVQVTDAVSNTSTCSITITTFNAISAGCPLAIGHASDPYNGLMPAAGGVPPYTFQIIAGSLPDGLTLDPATGIITGTPTIMGTSTFTWRLSDSLGAFVDTGCSIEILCPSAYEQAKFQLWSIKYVTERADRAEVTHSYDWDDLGWPWDKKLQNMTVEYDGSAGDVVFQMETLIGIQGTTPGPVMTFALSGAGRSKQPFPIPDNIIVKMVRISPTTAPALDFKSWKYNFQKIDYPIDISLFTDRTIFGYPCEKIARNLELDIDTGGVEATIQLWADGAMKQEFKVTTTLNDRSRIIATQSNLIGREWWLELQPGAGGKTQLFSWNLDIVKEPCAVSYVDTYETNFGYPGFKWIKQGWLEYQALNPITVDILVDGGNLLLSITLPAHPVSRDVERFYLPPIDNTNQFLCKSKKYRVQISATNGTFKLYSDSALEWAPIGAEQRMREFLLSPEQQLPVG